MCLSVLSGEDYNLSPIHAHNEAAHYIDRTFPVMSFRHKLVLEMSSHCLCYRKALNFTNCTQIWHQGEITDFTNQFVRQFSRIPLEIQKKNNKIKINKGVNTKERRAKRNSCDDNKVLEKQFHPSLYNPFTFPRLERHFMMFLWPTRTHFFMLVDKIKVFESFSWPWCRMEEPHQVSQHHNSWP